MQLSIYSFVTLRLVIAIQKTTAILASVKELKNVLQSSEIFYGVLNQTVRAT